MLKDKNILKNPALQPGFLIYENYVAQEQSEPVFF